MENRPSLTAEYMALFRALESSRPAGARLFADPGAAIFLRGWRRWLNGMARFRLGLRLAEALLDRYAPGARAAGIARTKWIDDEVTAALETARQLVLLGAGFDMRAHRLPAAAGAVVFELDHPATSRAKQTLLKKGTRPLAEHVRYVGIDFSSQSILEDLAQAGFDNTRPACLIWEGVTNYLTAQAIDRVFDQVRQTAKDSLLIFTYVDRAVLDDPDRYFGARKLLVRMEAYGEPWLFGLNPGELKSYLADRGLELIQDLGVADVWKSTGRSDSGTRGYEYYRMAAARVSG